VTPGHRVIGSSGHRVIGQYVVLKMNCSRNLASIMLTSKWGFLIKRLKEVERHKIDWRPELRNKPKSADLKTVTPPSTKIFQIILTRLKVSAGNPKAPKLACWTTLLITVPPHGMDHVSIRSRNPHTILNLSAPPTRKQKY
jgi:hypothetical protein